jgi:hypothetical protein
MVRYALVKTQRTARSGDRSSTPSAQILRGVFAEVAQLLGVTGGERQRPMQ